MRCLVVLTLAAATLAGCSASEDEDTAPPEPAVATSDDERPAVMSAALEELVTKDHTFGAGPPPFTEYLIQSDLDPGAGSADGSDGEGRPLTEAERAAIEAAVEPLGPVRWIDDPDQWRTDDLSPTIEGAVILGVGEPTIDGTGALVPVSLWCGGLCGTWLTYQLDKADGAWQVTGTEGPVAIA